MKKPHFTQLALVASSGLFLITRGLAGFLFDKTLEMSQLSEELLRGERLPLLNTSIDNIDRS
ncbi:MAG: hypothetical protein WCO81_12545 [Cyanobacteriota bacterium ELA615]|jgi:hypothetical protein